MQLGTGEVVEAVDVLAISAPFFDTGNDGDAEPFDDFTTVAAALSGDDQASSGSFTRANGITLDWTAVSEIVARRIST